MYKVRQYLKTKIITGKPQLSVYMYMYNGELCLGGGGTQENDSVLDEVAVIASGRSSGS